MKWLCLNIYKELRHNLSIHNAQVEPVTREEMGEMVISGC